MGTRAQLITYAHTRTNGLAILDAALTQLEATELELSTWLDDSNVSRLNRWPIGAVWSGSGRWCGLLSDLLVIQDMTRAAFDPAIGQLTNVWGIHEAGRVPSAPELTKALALSGFELLDFSREDCTVVRQVDVTIDVGGFGKGEALDRVVAAGIAGPWLIDLGGQVAVAGAPPDAARWPITLAHPFERDREFLKLEIPPGSLATSAGSERDLNVEGERIGHILDPRTGRPSTFKGSVSVWHISGLYADALSTALYVMGPNEGLPWATQQGLSVVYLIPNGDQVRVEATPEFEPLILKH
jgi:thiamine biosynthesis lipoprotein